MCFLHLIAWRELIVESKEQFVYEKCQAWFSIHFFLFYFFFIIATTSKYDSFILKNEYKNCLESARYYTKIFSIGFIIKNIICTK